MIVELLGAGLAGALLHEAAHWTVATAAGRDAHIDWQEFETVWPTEKVEWQDCAAGLAPQTLGIVAAVCVLAGVVSVPLWVVPGWVTLTLTGSREDWALLKRYGETAEPSPGVAQSG